MKNILILTSKTGGGHVSLAEALRDLLVNTVQPEDTYHPNAIHDTNNAVISIVDPQPPLFHLHYRLVSRDALWLWAAEFRFLDTPDRSLLAHKIFARLMRHRLYALLDRVQPDLIITTYPFLSYEVAYVLQQRSSTIPLLMLFSDANSVHASWLTEQRANATFATTRETYKQALATGFAPERLHLVGWPVRAQFYRSDLSNREKSNGMLTQLNLVPNRFTIFLQGGGEGATRIASTIENILTSETLTNEVQIILAAGTNQKLLTRYRNVPNIATQPHTNDIAPYMATADLIMGKAGPNILFESVTLGKPFVATTFIPGQEQENLAFIQRHHLGWVAIQPEEQRALLLELIHNPPQLEALSNTINAYRDWNINANQQIFPLIRQLIP
jgi:UDP-N-acetylglucosamine:LPS N-acetylglucosamine transferase